MAQKKGSATLWVKDGWVLIRAPYDKRFVAEFKERVPASMRSWDPDEKLWKANPSQDVLVVEIVTKYYGEPTVLEDKEVIVISAEDDDPYGALLRLAPDTLLPKIFRLIAASVHPDAGGTGEQMTRANQAWVAIKADRGM